MASVNQLVELIFMSHDLKPLLEPTAIAIIGASQKAGTVGNEIIVNLIAGNYAGEIYPINPRYESISGYTCFADLSQLPVCVDHVILAVGDERLEAAFKSVVGHKAKACTILTSLLLEVDAETNAEDNLKARIAMLAEEAGILLLGGNSMGFYNFSHNVRTCGFVTRNHSRSGNVSLISQSGAGMAGILDVEQRIDFNFAASTGQEIGVGLEELLDYALDLPSTKVVGLFMETCRKPDSFRRALAKANARKIPVVVLKVGRSELAAKLAISHSGALAGHDGVFDAVFEKYGVLRVDDMNQLATALMMFAQPFEIADGGLASIHDSGGERQLLADLAASLDVPLAILSEESERLLNDVLEPGMPAVNPLDAWGKGGPDADQIIRDSFSILVADVNTAMGAINLDCGPDGKIYDEYFSYLRAANKLTGKPVFFVTNHQGVEVDPLVLEITRAGFPVIEGLQCFLVGARCLMQYRDFLGRKLEQLPSLDPVIRSKWSAVLSGQEPMGEQLTSLWLTECGLPMALSREISSLADLQQLESELSYPLVLKTAEPGIAHKSDVGGVVLNIASHDALIFAYRQMSASLGVKAIVSPMVTEPGLEMILGIVTDADFGPVVVLGLGGVQAEILDDVVMVLPPFDKPCALRAVVKLKHKNLFAPVRGRAAVDLDAFCEAAARFSSLAIEFGEQIAEVEINPIRVLEKGCIGLDALLVLKSDQNTRNSQILEKKMGGN